MAKGDEQFYPYNIKEDTHPLGALWELPVILPSDGHASTATLLSLDASLAITPRVLRFEASRTRTGATGQTGLAPPVMLSLRTQF